MSPLIQPPTIAVVINFKFLLSILSGLISLNTTGFSQENSNMKHNAILSEVVNATSIKEFKKIVPFASEWKEIHLGKSIFVICLQDLPSYGQSNSVVKVWKQTRSNKFELIYFFRTTGLGEIDIAFDKKTSLLRIDAKKNKEIIILGSYSFLAYKD